MKKLFLLRALLLPGLLSLPAYAWPDSGAIPSAQRLSDQEFRDATEAELNYGVLQRRLIGFINARCGAIAKTPAGLLDLRIPADFRGCHAAGGEGLPKMQAKLASGATATAVFCPDRAPAVDCGR